MSRFPYVKWTPTSRQIQTKFKSAMRFPPQPRVTPLFRWTEIFSCREIDPQFWLHRRSPFGRHHQACDRSVIGVSFRCYETQSIARVAAVTPGQLPTVSGRCPPVGHWGVVGGSGVVMPPCAVRRTQGCIQIRRWLAWAGWFVAPTPQGAGWKPRFACQEILPTFPAHCGTATGRLPELRCNSFGAR